MSVRAPSHSAALARLRKFRESQAAERAKLTAELEASKAAYEEWVSPKRRLDKAKSMLAGSGPVGGTPPNLDAGEPAGLWM